MSNRPRVAIVGAGVSGLTCGVVLQEANYDVTVFSSDAHPSVSPVAAAIWYPYHIEDPKGRVDGWGLESYRRFEELACVRGTGVSMVWFEVLGDLGKSLPEWALAMPHRDVPGAGFAVEVPLIETPVYLPWLEKQIDRRRNETIHNLADMEREFDVVVNCSGLGARRLCNGVLESGRGIVLKTKSNAGIQRFMVAKEGDTLTYVISRPCTGDLLLGGIDDTIETEEGARERAQEIHARCARVDARLPAEYEHAVGFRPVGKPVRVEREPGTRIIHNFGHGGAGFTVSWGCAREVLRLVQSVRKPG